MQAFLALIRAEIRLYLSNRKALLLSLVAPILIAAFFGSLFGGSGNSKPAGIPVAVVDQDHSELSARVVAALKAESSLRVSEPGADEGLEQVRAGKLRALAILPAGLGQQAGAAMFGAAAKPEITLHYDPSQATVLSIVRGLLAQTLMQEVSRSTFSAKSPVLRSMAADLRASTDLPAERKSDLVRMFDAIDKVQSSDAAASSAANPMAGGLSLPYTTRELEAVQSERNAAPVAYNGYAHSFAGMGVQFLLMSGIDLAVGLLLMRRLGLWKRLRAAPLSRWTLLGSRVAASALICFSVFCVIYAAAVGFFGVRVLGSWPGLVMVLVAFSLMTASFGLLVAAIGGTPEATRGVAILATLLMVMLGGAWVPSFLFPEWLQTASFAVPTRWAIDALEAMTWRGQGFTAALQPTGVMLAFSAAFALIGVWRFRWEE
jgi:ABC-2 type transport system permease protein